MRSTRGVNTVWVRNHCVYASFHRLRLSLTPTCFTFTAFAVTQSVTACAWKQRSVYYSLLKPFIYIKCLYERVIKITCIYAYNWKVYISINNQYFISHCKPTFTHQYDTCKNKTLKIKCIRGPQVWSDDTEQVIMNRTFICLCERSYKMLICIIRLFHFDLLTYNIDFVSASVTDWRARATLIIMLLIIRRYNKSLRFFIPPHLHRVKSCFKEQSDVTTCSFN